MTPLVAGSELTAEKCVSLAPGLRRIVAGNAGMMTGPGTNKYLLGLRVVERIAVERHHCARLTLERT